MQKLSNFIGGEFRGPARGEYLDNREPATGAVYSQVPASTESDVAQAVEAARAAFPAWSKLDAETRSSMLMKVADAVDRESERLARLESVDNGKPISLAGSVDIPRASRNLRFFASAAVSFASESHEMGDRAINYTIRRPLGVAGCISPWNLPLYLFTWKVAPALAAGNCVVAKPSELTPMTAHHFCELVRDAGLPPGVLNVVHGRGPEAGAPIVSHPDVPVLSFTGGTQTGAEIARNAAPLFKKLSLELGGKNPNIIFADANYERMLDDTIRSAFSNQGQVCLSGSRIYVERTLYDRFREDFVRRVQALRVGDPLERETQQGAVVSEEHLKKVLHYLSLAAKEGANVLTGGDQVEIPGRCQGGWFVQPTVLDGLSPDSRTNQEEIFGPVVTMAPFDAEEEALELANGTRYGLATMLWTDDLTLAHRMARKLDVGIVWVNGWMVRDLRTPFGGTKDSGVGREGGLESFYHFTEPKNVCIQLES